MNLNSKSTLAKLLARENITVQHGNFRTAFFDVNSRILGLPLWKDRGRDVYDLLVGHEVGHALFTPAEGWHNAGAVDGLPKDYLNVVEDIRIEKLIQRQYPGLVGSFKRGYKALDHDNFFEIRGKDVNRMHFMNRLNLKAKLRDLIDVTFSEEEQPYVDMAMAVETWDDVVRVSTELYGYMQKLQEQNRVLPTITIPQIDDAGDDGVNEDPSEGEKHERVIKAPSPNTPEDAKEADDAKPSDTTKNADSEPEQVEQPSQASDSKEAKSSEQTDDEAKDGSSESASGSTSAEDQKDNTQAADIKAGEKSNSDKRSEVKAPGGEGGDGVSSDINQIDTDRAYRSNEQSLLDVDDKGYQPLLVRGLTDKQIDEMIIPYELIKASRAKRLAELTETSYDMTHWDRTQEYKEFVSETEKFVNLMAKEFEMRKAAFQYSRSQSARSGSLDVSKLYNYKFSDDIFRRVTRLADAKNHGMIMLVDYSGSMHGVMPQVIKQILTLAMFCKKINIPFDVYGFTNMNIAGRTYEFKPQLNDLHHEEVVLTHQLSSTFNKRDYDLAFRQMFYQTAECGNRYFGGGPSTGEYDELGGTPLNEVLTAMPRIIERFKARHNVEKTIMTILTDGDAQHMHVETNFEIRYATKGFAVQLKNGLVKVNKERELTPALVDHLRKKCGVVTIGYFLADSRYSFNGAVGRAAGDWNHSTFAAARKAIAAQKFVSYDDTIGYDKYFVIRCDGRNLDTDTDEFEVANNAKASDIRRAFKKFTTSKKLNRVLATQFAEAIS